MLTRVARCRTLSRQVVMRRCYTRADVRPAGVGDADAIADHVRLLSYCAEPSDLKFIRNPEPVIDHYAKVTNGVRDHRMY